MSKTDKFIVSTDDGELQRARDIIGLQAIFGADNNIEFDKDKNAWNVTGQLKDGICPGGQEFSCSVKRAVIDDREGTTYYLWQMDELSVAGQNISELMEAPTYLIRPSYEPDISDPWSSFIASMDGGFDYDNHRIFLYSGLQTMDQFVSLVHENGHAIHDLNTKVVSQTQKMFRSITRAIAQDIAAGLSEDESITAAVKQLNEKGIFDLVRSGAIDTFTEEVTVNRLAFELLNEFRNNQEMFKDESSLVRLRKMLTVTSLSYVQTINKIFGQGTVDPRHAEIT